MNVVKMNNVKANKVSWNEGKGEAVMSTKLEVNEDAITGLSIGTAFFRSGWDEHTTVSEVENRNGWDEIIEIADGYLQWVGLPHDGLTRDDVLQSIWNHEDWEEYLEEMGMKE